MLVVVDLADAPTDQLEAITTQLGNKRVEMGQNGIKTLIVANKIDIAGADESYQALKNQYKGQLPIAAVSAKEGTDLEALKRNIYEMLAIIRVYTKAPGEKPDFTDPIILERGSTLEDAAADVHKDFAHKLKYARIWGSGKHDGIMARRDHTLQDGDIIELHL